MPRPVVTAFLLISICLLPDFGSAQQFDETMAWPLCGRINEAPPQGWIETDGCPSARWDDPNFNDLPISSPFGPRRLSSENDRYDFHRGIDIPTPEMTPVFAIADGIVKIAGSDPGYSDPLVQLRHYRPGHSSCDNVGCYHTNYLHLLQALVADESAVSKGDLIGYSGSSASGFEHLHFEIRDAPAFDVLSRWQRDAINPLEGLPYQSPESATISFDAVDTSNPLNPVVLLTVQTLRRDVSRVDLTLSDSSGNAIAQPGNVADSKGYNVHPSWFGMHEWNFQYSHKNSSSIPWESFGQGGANECPYYADHGASYSAHVHMDQQHPLDPQVGLFNGVESFRGPMVDDVYSLELSFHELQGPADCIVAEVFFAAGGSTTAEWGNCSGTGGFSDYTASSEVLHGGTQQGTYVDTWVQNDGAAEVINERRSGGKPKNRYSFLDHEWDINIGAGGDLVTLWIDAYSSVSSDGDVFEVTVTGSSDTLTINKTSDNDSYQTLTLPGGTSGIVSVRLRDGNQSPGTTALDSVTVDHLFIRVESAGQLDPPPAPGSVNATAVSASSVTVIWVHSGDTESGFKIERQQQNTDLSWGAWSGAGTASADATSFGDTGLLSQATYRYQVAATNAAGDSAWVQSSAVSTPLPPAIAATVSGYKRKGWQYVDVSWSGAPAGFLDIWRSDGAATVAVALRECRPVVVETELSPMVRLQRVAPAIFTKFASRVIRIAVRIRQRSASSTCRPRQKKLKSAPV